MELFEVGLTRKDLEKDMEIEVWEENLQVFQIFAVDLATQWRIGMAGATGLDYSVLPFVFRARRIPRARWEQAFEDIQVMEAAALKEMQEPDGMINSETH